jgi:hypothetical protein
MDSKHAVLKIILLSLALWRLRAWGIIQPPIPYYYVYMHALTIIEDNFIDSIGEIENINDHEYYTKCQ